MASNSPWHHIYNTKHWYRLCYYQLQKQPLCEFHLRRNQVIDATVVDHVTPHKGDEALFHDPDIRDGIASFLLGMDAQDNALAIGGGTLGNTRYRIWHEGITTVDANGFIKRASPVVKVYSDGSAELNAESAALRLSASKREFTGFPACWALIPMRAGVVLMAVLNCQPTKINSPWSGLIMRSNQTAVFC